MSHHQEETRFRFVVTPYFVSLQASEDSGDCSLDFPGETAKGYIRSPPARSRPHMQPHPKQKLKPKLKQKLKLALALPSPPSFIFACVAFFSFVHWFKTFITVQCRAKGTQKGVCYILFVVIPIYRVLSISTEIML